MNSFRILLGILWEKIKEFWMRYPTFGCDILLFGILEFFSKNYFHFSKSVFLKKVLGFWDFGF
jgi:hypothetical protein